MFGIGPAFAVGKVPSTGPAYPDAANLRAHLDLVTAGNLFSDTSHTTPSAIGDRIRAAKMVDGAGAVSYADNTVGATSSPIRRSGGASFGEASETNYLNTGIVQSNPYTVYTKGTRDAGSGIMMCDAGAETTTFIQHYVPSGHVFLWGQGGGYTLTGITDPSGVAVRGTAFDGTSSVGFVDSTEVTAGSPPHVAASWTVRLGCSNGTFRLEATYSQVMIYDGFHDATARAAVRAFLATLP